MKENTRRTQWVPVDMQEIFTVIAMVLLMGILKKNSYKKYWSQDPLLSTPIFGQLMALNRFVDIMGNLHFFDILANNLLNLPSDTMRRIRPIFDHLRNAFSTSFQPYRKLCVDESLVLWRGKAHFRQYIPSKRHRFGLKLFVICDCQTGYILDMILYTGDQTQLRPSVGFGQAERVVQTH